MKKLFLLLILAITTTSCLSPNDENFGCFVWGTCESQMFKVYAYSVDNVDFDVYGYIEAPDGWEAKWGKTLMFTAIDPPGYKFTGWVNDPQRSYCYRVEPDVDAVDFRTVYVYGDLNNMQGCNSPNDENYLAATYVKIN